MTAERLAASVATDVATLGVNQNPDEPCVHSSIASKFLLIRRHKDVKMQSTSSFSDSRLARKTYDR